MNVYHIEDIFKKIRRQDRLLDEARALELLETAEYGFLSLGIIIGKTNRTRKIIKPYKFCRFANLRHLEIVDNPFNFVLSLG